MKRLFFCAFLVFFQLDSAWSAELVAPNHAKQIENYVTSWVGNTYGGLNPQTGKGQWVQQDIAAMCVTPDGTVYTNVPWEEAGGNCSMYKDGEMLGRAGHTHGWGPEGGKAVAVNDKYVFIGLAYENEGGNLVDPDTWPPKGKRWFGISRRLRSDFTQGAPFEHGKGGKGDTLPKCFLVVNEVPEPPKGPVEFTQNISDLAAISGLWATNERLYVSNPYQNRIEIYDTETMKKISEWDLNRMGFSRPGQIAADKQGNLWIFLTIKTVIQGYDCDFQTIAQFSPDGKILPGRVTDFQEDAVRMMEKTGSSMSYTSDIHDTGPFCFGPDNTLYVFDPQLGIDVYPPESDGTNLGSFSSQKQKLLGICDTDQGCGPLPFFYPSGEFGDLRFGEYTVKALGCDANGNLYIAQDLSSSSGGAVLESYRILGDLKKPRYPFPDDWCQDKNDIPVCLDAKLNWRLFGLCFIDCATLDPDDETTAYTKDEKYKLDWSQPPGKEWSFLATTFQKSPDCNRSFLSDSAGVWIRNIRGRKFMFINDMNGQYLRRCEFDTPAYRKETNYREEEERMPGFSNWPVMKESEESILTFEKPDPVDDHVRQDDVRQSVYQAGFALIKCGHFREQERRLKEALKQEQSEFPPAQGWWVDLDCGIWRATETKGIFYIPAKPEQETDSSADDFCSDYFEADVKVFPHPTEFTQVKRIRYDAATDTLYLGGCATVDGVEHKNQHWKPMGAVICRYDHFLKGDNPGKTAGKLRWKIVVPYVTGSQGHESCEPMGFDIAGDYMFVPYTGASKVSGFKTGHVEVFRLSDGSSVGWMEPDQETIGEIGLQDIRECLSAHKRANGEYVIFLEDDYKAKVVMFRWQP